MAENNGIALLTVPEVADMLRVGKWVAWRLVWDGDLKSIKIRGSRRVFKESVEEYITKCSEQS